MLVQESGYIHTYILYTYLPSISLLLKSTYKNKYVHTHSTAQLQGNTCMYVHQELVSHTSYLRVTYEFHMSIGAVWVGTRTSPFITFAPETVAARRWHCMS